MKPGNIVLECESNRDAQGDVWDDSLRAVLVDFGLVREAGESGAAGPVASAVTPSYASPEQAQGRTVRAAADVFSLGVTLHDLLARRLPGSRNEASSGMQPLRQHAPAVSKDLGAVIDRACSVDETHRYPDADELLDDLHAVLEGRPVSARPIHVVARAVRAARREPARTLRILGAAVVGIAALASTAWVSREWDRAKRYDVAVARADPLAVVESARDQTVLSSWLLRMTSKHAPRDLDSYLVEIADTQRRGDDEAAMLIEASVLRTRGFEDLLLIDSLSRRLDDARGVFELGVVMRLFHDREVGDRVERAAVEPLLSRLRRIVTDPAALREARLRATSALSGGGGPSDLGICRELVRRYGPEAEESRLALVAAERIVRRSQRQGDLSDFALDVAEDALRELSDALVDTVVRPEPTIAYPTRHAAVLLAEAVALARRSRGMSAFVPWEPADVARRLADETPLVDLAADLLASAGREEIHPILRSGEWHLGAEHLGYLCGLLDDDAITRAAREGWSRRHPNPESDFRQFDSGVVRGRREWSGEKPILEPLGASRLQWPMTAPIWRASLPDASGGQDEKFAARWFFDRPDLPLASGALGTRLRAAEPSEDQNGRFVLLSQPGRSAVALRFRVPDEARGRLISAWVHAEAASRAYLPFGGSAQLRFELDGERLDTLRYDQDRRGGERLVPLPESRLGGGEHELSIFLEPLTTTTLLLHEVRLLAR